MNKYLEIFERIKADYGIKEDDENARELEEFLRAQGASTANRPAFTEIGLEKTLQKEWRCLLRKSLERCENS